MNTFKILRLLFQTYNLLKKAAINFKREAFSRHNLKYFLYYAIANFAILILYGYYQSLQPVDLSLKPVSSPASEGSFLLFLLSMILLPLSLFFEELAFRLMPMVWIRDILHLNRITISMEHEGKVTIVHNSSLRLWLYHHWWIVFIVVSALWAAWIHQLNIVESSPIGALIYFGVQAFSGAAFSWIYSRGGLGASWIVHVSWDFFLVFLNAIVVYFVLI